jgi:hypothetical protein
MGDGIDMEEDHKRVPGALLPMTPPASSIARLEITWEGRHYISTEVKGQDPAWSHADLIGVHVGLRAAAGLPDAEREVVVEAAGDHLIGRLEHAHEDGHVM